MPRHIGPNKQEFDEFGRPLRPAISRVGPGPLEQEYVTAAAQQPQFAPPGNLQRVLNAVAAGSEGYLQRSPAAGIETARDLTYGPHDRAMALHKQRLEGLAPGVEAERAGWQRGREEAGAKIAVRGAAIGERRAATGEGRLEETTTGRVERGEREERGLDLEGRRVTVAERPTMPTTYQSQRNFFETDPKGFAKMQEAMRPSKRTLGEDKELVGYREEMAAQFRREGAPQYPSGTIEAFYGTALARVWGRDPAYQEFVSSDDGMMRTDPPEVGTPEHAKFLEFLDAVDSELRRLMGMERGGDEGVVNEGPPADFVNAPIER